MQRGMSYELLRWLLLSASHRVRGPVASAAVISSLTARFRILPVAPRGSSVSNTMCLGVSNREQRPTKLKKFISGRAVDLVQDDHCTHRFTPAVVGDADYARLGDGWMPAEHLLHDNGVHVVAPVMMRNFLRSTRKRCPSSSSLPRSPVCSQPSRRVSAVSVGRPRYPVITVSLWMHTSPTSPEPHVRPSSDTILIDMWIIAFPHDCRSAPSDAGARE